MMLEFRTQGFNGYSVKYSPFFDSRLAVAASANFGLVGNGRLYILGLTPDGGVVAERWFDTQDSLFDTTWSEAHENQLLAGSGDGSIKLFDLSVGGGASTSPDDPSNFPVAAWSEHAREVFSVSWNLVSKDVFSSSSWDGSVKVWNPTRPASTVTLPTHSCTYSAQWSPHSASLLSAVCSDSHLRLFDLRTPASATNHLVLTIPLHAAPSPSGSSYPPKQPHAPHQQQPYEAAAAAAAAGAPPPPAEALTHDWNKYRDTVVAAAGVDRAVRTFDIRAPGQGPLCVLPGHRYAVRRVAWSPHLPDLLLSASYDMTVRVWTDGSGGDAGMAPAKGMAMPGEPVPFGAGREMGAMGVHTEFVTGVDWCLFGAEGWCASCGWDERVLVWDARSVMGPGGRA